MEMLQHLWTYHSIHIIGLLGVCLVLEYNSKRIKQHAKSEALKYINN